MKLRIGEIRNHKKLSVRQLARLSGVNKSTINRLENGFLPSALLRLEKIAKALNCDVKDLFDD